MYVHMCVCICECVYVCMYVCVNDVYMLLRAYVCILYIRARSRY